MIHLTRINRLDVVVNADLIEQIETTPDTVVHFTSGQKLVVRESVDEIIRMVVQYRQLIHCGCPVTTTSTEANPAAPGFNSSPAAPAAPGSE